MSFSPAWLSAIGTVGAFAVALSLLGLQTFDRRAQSNDKRVAQARLVSTWLTDVLAEERSGDTVSDPSIAFPRLVVLVKNGSAEPVYDVVIAVGVGTRGTFLRRPGALGPTEIRRLLIPIPSDPRGTPTPEIAFTDSAGRRWLRLGTGQLKEIGDWESEPKEDPGAYASEEDHPTLRLGLDAASQRGERL